jgi:GrpB-like predicted nucleotidyltransferase (UPF0157 family)
MMAARMTESDSTENEPIVIADYSPEWPRLFAAELSRLGDLLPGASIEHVGSTAVPGLSAKPVIDMLVGLDSLSPIMEVIPALDRIGFEYVPELESFFPERRYFRRLVAGRRTHQIHAVEEGCPFWARTLAFRDALRVDPALARAYADLKQDLAARHRMDRLAYTDGKTEFVEGVLASVGRSAGVLPHQREP